MCTLTLRHAQQVVKNVNSTVLDKLLHNGTRTSYVKHDYGYGNVYEFEIADSDQVLLVDALGVDDVQGATIARDLEQWVREEWDTHWLLNFEFEDEIEE